MADNYLIHYGKGHLDGGHSGRYPWGSKLKEGVKQSGRAAKTSVISNVSKRTTDRIFGDKKNKDETFGQAAKSVLKAAAKTAVASLIATALTVVVDGTLQTGETFYKKYKGISLDEE